MNTRLVRSPGIFLVGFMACGKTTLGRMLARRLGWAFADLDDDIEEHAGMKIADLFASRGEEAFRQIETEMLTARLKKVERGEATVLSLGGGAFVRPENRQRMEGIGFSVWLDAPLPLLERRVARTAHRPLAHDKERFRELYLERQPLYAQADYRVPVAAGHPGANLTRILDLPIFKR